MRHANGLSLAWPAGGRVVEAFQPGETRGIEMWRQGGRSGSRGRRRQGHVCRHGPEQLRQSYHRAAQQGLPGPRTRITASYCWSKPARSFDRASRSRRDGRRKQLARVGRFRVAPRRQTGRSDAVSAARTRLNAARGCAVGGLSRATAAPPRRSPRARLPASNGPRAAPPESA